MDPDKVRLHLLILRKCAQFFTGERLTREIDFYLRVMLWEGIEAAALEEAMQDEKLNLARVTDNLLRLIAKSGGTRFEQFKLYMCGHGGHKLMKRHSIEVPRDVSPSEVNWRSQMEIWALENQEAYLLCVDFARKLKEAGRPFSIHYVREHVRYQGGFWNAKGGYSSKYSFSNSMSPYLARMLIDNDPDLARFIECREVRW